MKRKDLVWVALAIVVVCAAMVAWEMHSKPAPAPSAVAAQPTKPAPGTPLVSSPPPAVGAIVIGNGAGLVKLRPTEDPGQDSSYLSITLSSKGEMLLQDSQARRLGFDSQAHKLVRQIANASYDEGDMIDDDDDSAPNSPPPSPTPTPTPPATLSGLEDNGFRRMEVFQPAPGKYVLTVIARNEANYNLLLHFRKRDGNLSTAAFDKVAVSSGEVHVYEFEIPTDASGEIKAERRQAAASH